MYLNIGNNHLIDEKEVVAIVNPACFKVEDLEKLNLEKVFSKEKVRSLVITSSKAYLSNLSPDYINKKTRKEVI